MALKDCQELVARMEKSVGQGFAEAPETFNIPGRSLACKVDPNYYLAVDPGFVNGLARWCGCLPGNVRQALLRSGNIVSTGKNRKHVIRVGVTTGGDVVEISAVFVLAEFLDRSFTLFGHARSALEISSLRIAPGYEEAVQELFDGKTAPHKMAFAESAENS